jgi:3-hydroxy-9,10-secoandrosta-1,3,5(10)-triene-9,17-dione monooxygenase
VKREVFGEGPVALWTSVLPRAQSVAVEAGYRVSGRFGWGSGSSLARWAVVAEGLPDRDGKQWFRAYVVPKSDVERDLESWKPMGLEAPRASTMQSPTSLSQGTAASNILLCNPRRPARFRRNLGCFSIKSD